MLFYIKGTVEPYFLTMEILVASSNSSLELEEHG
jgi:hypothetical protein